MTILSRLLALVAVALLPAIAIQAYNEFDLRRTRQVEVQNQALSLAKLAAEEQQQIVQGIRQVLIALSELPAIKAKDAKACNAALTGMKSRFPAFLTLLVTDQNGQPFCFTNSDRKPVNVSSRAYFAEALKTRAFTVGEFSIGLSVPEKVIQFALPFYGNDGQIGGVIIAPLGLDWLADYIAQMGVPAGDALAITDRNGTYLARYPDNSQFVGKKLLPAGKGTQPGHGLAADLVDVDGVERIVGFSALGPDSGGLRVSFGLDKTRAFAEIQRRTRHDVLIITLSALIVLVLTLLGARHFVHRPLGLLVDAANQWRLGDDARRVNIHDRSEIAGVADAFNTMADALERRERELSDAKERAEDAADRLTMVFESTTDSVVIVDRDWCISFFNQRAWTQIAEGRELIGMKLQQALLDHPGVEKLTATFEKRCRTAVRSRSKPTALIAVSGMRSMRSLPAKVSRSSFETSPSTSMPWKRASSSRSSFIRARRWSRGSTDWRRGPRLQQPACRRAGWSFSRAPRTTAGALLRRNRPARDRGERAHRATALLLPAAQTQLGSGQRDLIAESKGASVEPSGEDARSRLRIDDRRGCARWTPHCWRSRCSTWR